MKKSVAAVALAGSLVVGGATGALLFGPSLAGAQTTTTTPGAQSGSQFKSNEDPAHEANETPEQEAAEDSGQFHRGHAGHGPNEDPGHEANETPEQEAAENARGAGKPSGGGTPGSAPSTTPSSGTNSAFRPGPRF